MSFLDSIILGLIQGLTEFIPVSSTGHLVIASQLLGIREAFTYDVLLNFGTLLALVVYYRQKSWNIIINVLKVKDWGLISRLIVATIPAGVIGIIFADQITTMNTMIWVVIAMLVVVGIPMIVAGKEITGNQQQKAQKISFMTSIKIGLAQAVALIPGASRSGTTILTGLRCGLSAKKAAEFSFLMAIPIIAAASLKTLLSSSGLNFVHHNLGAVIVGNLVSFAAGLLAVHWLVSLISRRGLKDFGWYRLGLALILVILLLTGII
jgi:undecaprenyl-diphosphatase